jgi:hypothetical protein
MLREKPVTALAIGLTLLVACATTTTLQSTWKAPDAQPVSPAGKSIAAVFITADESLRRSGENAMVADLVSRGARAFGTYFLLPGDQHLDAEIAEARLRAAGANAVVTMRVVGQDQRITYTPGRPVPEFQRGFRPYWGSGWRNVYQPGTLSTDTLVSVETLLYSLPAGQGSQLLWASSSRTTNPRDVSALASEVANATATEMVRQGLVTR